MALLRIREKIEKAGGGQASTVLVLPTPSTGLKPRAKGGGEHPGNFRDSQNFRACSPLLWLWPEESSHLSEKLLGQPDAASNMAPKPRGRNRCGACSAELGLR